MPLRALIVSCLLFRFEGLNNGLTPVISQIMDGESSTLIQLGWFAKHRYIDT